MSHHSETRYIIGRLDNGIHGVAAMLSELKISPPSIAEAALPQRGCTFLHNVEIIGPALVLDEIGGGARGIEFTVDSLQKLKQGILQIEHFDGYNSISKTLFIGGELVWEQEAFVDGPLLQTRGPDFQPRNVAERQFFEALKVAMERRHFVKLQQNDLKRLPRQRPELHSQLMAYFAECSEERERECTDAHSASDEAVSKLTA